MKKKVLCTVFILAVIAVVGWNYSLKSAEIELSDLARANVEALAREEGPVDPNEGSGMKKEKCYYPNGNVKGQTCKSSSSPYDKCHYINDVWGKCD